MNNLGKISQQILSSEQASWFEVNAESAGQRIDNFLLRVCKGVPKSHVYRIVRSGEVRVNKKRIVASYRLVTGDRIRVPPIRIQPERMIIGGPILDLPVMYEDQYMVVLNKPPGVAVHGGSGIALGVIESLRRLRPDAPYLELVHRLDRETSGILLLAKKRTALLGLHAQLRQGQIEKRYLVCAKGEWHDRQRVVKAPLYKYLTAEGERRVRVHEQGQSAHTVFTLRERFAHYVLLEADLKSGRTHQIRVHLAYLGLPIVGDDKYGDFELNKALARINAPATLKRMFLHAYYLRCMHPVTGEPLILEAPLPTDCERFLRQLRAFS